MTQVNDEMMVECDQAYDKAKHQIARFAAMKNKPGNPGEGKMEPAATKPPAPKAVNANQSAQSHSFRIKIDADEVRLSHILQLKAIFADHRGSTPVQIDFNGGGTVIATLKIDHPWGINPDVNFKNALKNLKVVSEC